jgi:hypothetical protein
MPLATWPSPIKRWIHPIGCPQRAQALIAPDAPVTCAAICLAGALDVSTALLKPSVSARRNPPGANTAPNKVQDDGKSKNADDRHERQRFISKGLHSEHKKDHDCEQDAGQQ